MVPELSERTGQTEMTSTERHEPPGDAERSALRDASGRKGWEAHGA